MKTGATNEFVIKYGDRTKENYIHLFEESKLDETLVKDIQENIAESHFEIVEPFKEFIDMVEPMKQYIGRVKCLGEYSYFIRFTLKKDSADVFITYRRVPSAEVAERDAKDLEKRIAEIFPCHLLDCQHHGAF